VSERPSPKGTARRDLILILDFGSQYTQLIARRVREQKVYSEIHPFNIPISKIRELAPRGIILSGGPSSSYDAGAPRISTELYDLGIPVLGICYGVQLTALLLGGQVAPAERREYGRASLKIKDATGLFHGFSAGEELSVWMSHGDRIEKLPDGFAVSGESANCPAAAVAAPARKFWGVQFHPRSRTRPAGARSSRTFSSASAGASRPGRWRASSTRPWRPSRRPWARAGAPCAACRAASTRRWPRRSSCAPWASA